MSSRQTDLLAGEDWTSIYRGFTQINFNATDPVSINQALRQYIAQNYPENFNDWIISSEFVAITDLLSWLAGTLAYKTDLAARENFIDTAESRESILRLARFLSYNPSRCQPSTGVVKLVQVMTNEDIYDSSGTNLANTQVIWNDPNNINWQEQFTLVMNAAFVATNPFGIPLSSGTVASITTDLYRINGLASASNLSFSSTVSGTSMSFEICNGDFSNGGTLFERDPDPANALQLYYLNDNNGYASVRTGFFLLFKQGSTAQQVFNIATPVQDQLLDLGVSNVNENDVWVDTVDDNGTVQIDWTKVPASFNNNITYNNLPNTVRTIYSVLTRDNDQVTIRFSDGSFGLAPVGNIAVTYRVSNGLAYQIQPNEISNVTLPIQYFNAAGSPKLISLTFSLQETVANASAAETIEQIRQRAPQVYGTQNRMVSGQDYNSFPLSSNLAVKINAVNRVYSGQSRYIDLQDPTGTYQDLSIFGEDGLFFSDPENTYFEVPTTLNATPLQIFNDYIVPAIDQYTTANFIRDVLMQNVLKGVIKAPIDQAGAPFTWAAASTALFATTGTFIHDANRGRVALPALPAAAGLITAGALLQFLVNGTSLWVSVISISLGSTIDTALVANTAGPVTLSQSLPTGAILLDVVPQVVTTVSSTLNTVAGLPVNMLSNYLSQRLSFSLLYDYTSGLWVLGTAQNNFGAPQATLGGPNGTTLLVGIINFVGGVWRINTRGLGYVFESLTSVEFFDNGTRGLAQNTAEAETDNLRVLRINPNLNDPRGYALGVDYNLTIDRLWTYPDGTTEPRRTTVLFADSNGDGVPDRPDTFYNIIATTPTVPIIPPTTWDPNYKLPTTTLTNGNLTVTPTANIHQLTRSTTTKSSGQFYFEYLLTMIFSSFTGVGICNAAEPVNPLGIPGGLNGGVADFNAIGFYSADNQAIYFGGVQVSVGPTNPQMSAEATGSRIGDVIGIAVDFTNQLFWVTSPAMVLAGMPWNNSTTADPATGTGGISLSALNAGPYYVFYTDTAAGAVTTINFGQTAFTKPIPTGFIGWDNVVTNPTTVTVANQYLFWTNTANAPFDEPYYLTKGYDTDVLLQADYPAIGTVGFQLSSSVTPLANETFWVYSGTAWVQDTTGSYRFAIGRGPNVAATWLTASANGPIATALSGAAMFFHWQHLAPNDHRIDPSNTNIIDIFVLTYSYDSAIRQWIVSGAIASQQPYPPTELDLSVAFAALEDFKMFSDSIVWRPVQYKFLFGANADPGLQAKFKVVRAINSSVSDGEIQSGILAAINAFFAVSNWDFGETFYFTELAAYIHQQLVGQILSVVIVPVVADGAFGDGFQSPCEPNEIFISVAEVADIVLITSNTATNLRINT